MTAKSRLIVILILLVIILQIGIGVNAQASDARNKGEKITLHYDVSANSEVYILISNNFINKYIDDDSNIIIDYSLKTKNYENYTITMLDGAFALLLIPKEFSVSVSGYVPSDKSSFNGTINVIINNSKILLLKINMSLIRYNDRPEVNYTVNNYTINVLYDNFSLSYQYEFEYVGGVIPITRYGGFKSVEPVGVFFARPFMVGNYSITTVESGNIYPCNSIDLSMRDDFEHYFKRFTLTPALLVLDAPPGREYNCCGVRYEASETMVPVDSLSAGEAESIVKSVARILSNETGILFKERRDEIAGFVLVRYDSEPIKIVNESYDISVVYRLKSVVGSDPEYDPLYHAGYGFLVELNASNLTAMAALHSILSDAFFLGEAMNFPFGFSCWFRDWKGDLAESLASLSEVTTFSGFNLSVRLVGVEVEEPGVVTVPPEGGGGLPGVSPGGGWRSWLVAGVVAVALLAAFVLVRGRRGSRGFS